MEKAIAAIWKDVLKLEKIGVHDNFFDLGGHSLLATRVVSRVRQVFGKDLGLRAMFENPTIARLAVVIDAKSPQGKGSAVPPLTAISRRSGAAGTGKGHAGVYRSNRSLRRHYGRRLDTTARAAGLSGQLLPPPLPSALGTGAFLSSIGTWTQDLALSWLIHSRFGNPFYLGLRSFAQELPLLTFMLLGGAIADRIDRRRILLSSQWFQAAMAVLLGVLYVADRLDILAIVAIAFATGLMQSQSAPTYQAVITSLVPRDRIANTVALNSLQFNLSRAVGPVVAGLLLAHAGAGSCFAANALSFTGVILALRTIEFPPPAAAGGESLRESLLVGLRHVSVAPACAPRRCSPRPRASWPSRSSPTSRSSPATCSRRARQATACCSPSVGIGAIVGAVGTAHRGRAAGRGRLMLVAFAIFGAFTVGAVLSRWQWLSMALLVGSGLTLTTAFSTLNSLVQELAPDELRGRVLSIFGLAFRGGGSDRRRRRRGDFEITKQ